MPPLSFFIHCVIPHFPRSREIPDPRVTAWLCFVRSLVDQQRPSPLYVFFFFIWASLFMLGAKLREQQIYFDPISFPLFRCHVLRSGMLACLFRRVAQMIYTQSGIVSPLFFSPTFLDLSPTPLFQLRPSRCPTPAAVFQGSMRERMCMRASRPFLLGLTHLYPVFFFPRPAPAGLFDPVLSSSHRVSSFRGSWPLHSPPVLPPKGILESFLDFCVPFFSHVSTLITPVGELLPLFMQEFKEALSLLTLSFLPPLFHFPPLLIPSANRDYPRADNLVPLITQLILT